MEQFDLNNKVIEIDFITKSMQLDKQLIPCWLKKHQINKKKVETLVVSNFERKSVFRYGVTIKDLEKIVKKTEQNYQRKQSFTTKQSLEKMKEVLVFLKTITNKNLGETYAN